MRAPIPALVLAALLVPAVAFAQNADVTATVSTGSYSSNANAPASAAIWPHPTDPARSVLLIADPAAGLLLSPLDGGQPTRLINGSWAGVSVREHFLLAGERVTLIAASDRTGGVVQLFTLDDSLDPVFRGEVNPGTGGTLAGTALSFDPGTGEAWLFVSDSPSTVQQFQLQDLGDGGVSAAQVRTLPQSSRASHLAVDLENARLFVVEDAVAVWSYEIDPFSGTERTLIDSVGTTLFAPIGGVSTYPSSIDTGYLVVASPSDDRVHLYEKEGAFTAIGSLRVMDPNTALAANAPGAIAVFNRPAGGFGTGLLAVEDRNLSNNSVRFLLVPWQDVAAAFDPPLSTDPNINPGAPDAGTGGDVDGGTADAGNGGGSGGGRNPNDPVLPGPNPDVDDPPVASGCGCLAAPAASALWVACLAALLLRRRRES